MPSQSVLVNVVVGRTVRKIRCAITVSVGKCGSRSDCSKDTMCNHSHIYSEDFYHVLVLIGSDRLLREEVSFCVWSWKQTRTRLKHNSCLSYAEMSEL